MLWATSRTSHPTLTPTPYFTQRAGPATYLHWPPHHTSRNEQDQPLTYTDPHTILQATSRTSHLLTLTPTPYCKQRAGPATYLHWPPHHTASNEQDQPLIYTDPHTILQATSRTSHLLTLTPTPYCKQRAGPATYLHWPHTILQATSRTSHLFTLTPTPYCKQRAGPATYLYWPPHHTASNEQDQPLTYTDPHTILQATSRTSHLFTLTTTPYCKQRAGPATYLYWPPHHTASNEQDQPLTYTDPHTILQATSRTSHLFTLTPTPYCKQRAGPATYLHWPPHHTASNEQDQPLIYTDPHTILQATSRTSHLITLTPTPYCKQRAGPATYLYWPPHHTASNEQDQPLTYTDPHTILQGTSTNDCSQMTTNIFLPIASWFVLIDDRLQNKTDFKH